MNKGGEGPNKKVAIHKASCAVR